MAMGCGAINAKPSAVGIIAEKIGLRTSAKGPRVTKAVRCSGSTPMRHEMALAAWA